MTDRSISQIEQALEQDRQALAQSLVALRERMRPAALMAEGKDALMAQAAPLVSKLDGAVRGQPLVAAAAGVALAALVFGRRRSSDLDAAGAVPAMAGTKFEALTRWEDEGGPPAPEPVDPEEGWLSEARGLREKAQTHAAADRRCRTSRACPGGAAGQAPGRGACGAGRRDGRGFGQGPGQPDGCGARAGTCWRASGSIWAGSRWPKRAGTRWTPVRLQPAWRLRRLGRRWRAFSRRPRRRTGFWARSATRWPMR